MSSNLENRLILQTSPGTLSRIASFKFALFCWQQHLKNYPNSLIFVEIKTTVEVSDVFKIPLPKRITNLINRHIELLKRKLHSWSQFHSLHVFGISRRDVIFNCLDCVVLKPSGSTICFESTAKNLIKSNRLGVMERYSIACMYCFKEEIESLWPLISKYFHRQTLSPAMIYWHGVNRKRHTDLPILKMNGYRGWYLPTKLKYCCKADAKIPKIEILNGINVEDETSLDIVIFLLSNLDTMHQNELISEFSIKLLRILALHDEEPSILTLQLWHYVKDYITNDQFSELIGLLCKFAFDISKSVDNNVKTSIIEIWTAASNHQQTTVVNKGSYFFYSRYIFQPINNVNSDMRNYGGNIEFYFHILNGTSFENRNKIWNRYWTDFITVANVSELNSLMSLCLRDADEVAEFIKNNIANYSRLIYKLQRFVLSGKYEELTEYLNFFYPNQDSVRETLQKILNLLLKDDLTLDVISMYNFDFAKFHACRFNLYSDQCMKFNDLIDQAFSSKNSAQQFKKDFILHYVDLRKKKLSSEFMVKEIRDMAEIFFSSDQQCLREMKQKIYEICRPFVVLKQPATKPIIPFSILLEWQEFFEWCGFKEEFISKFGTNEICRVVIKSQKSRKPKGFRNFFSKLMDIF